MRRRQIKEPSVRGMLFTAVSGLALGSLLGIVILLATEPRKLQTTPESSKHEIGDYRTTYTPGEMATTDSASFEIRLRRFLRKIPGPPIEFSEREVNYFLAQFATARPVGDGEKAPKIRLAAPFARLEPESITLISELSINPATQPFKLVVQIKGSFVDGTDGPKFQSEEMLLNSLPLPKPLHGRVLAKLDEAELPTEFTEAWSSLKSVESSDDLLLLKL